MGVLFLTKDKENPCPQKMNTTGEVRWCTV